MSLPLFSVVMINRNDAPWIPGAVESVLTQKDVDFELIFVDDGSSDASPDVIRELARRDSRVMPVILSENVGISAARNRGIDAARGEFIALLDSDDRFLPDTLGSYHKNWIELSRAEPRMCMLATDAWLINEKGARFGRYFTTDHWGKVTTRDAPRWLLPSTWMFPKAVPVRFHEPYRIVDAPIFIARMFAHGAVGFVGEPMMEYRLRSKSVSNSKGALNLRIRNATAVSIERGLLDNPLGPEDLPDPLWSQVAAWTHGRNAKALAANGRWFAAAWEGFLAFLARPFYSGRKILEMLRQRLKLRRS